MIHTSIQHHSRGGWKSSLEVWTMRDPQGRLGRTNNSSRSPCEQKWEKCLLAVILFQCIAIIVVFEQLKLNHGQEVETTVSNDGQKIITGGLEDRPLPFSFSACLMIKDNNVLLPEWLAYHYTFLPLRRLIVVIDPLSHTDPKPIFDAYGSIGMNISIWTDDLFWVDGGNDYEKLNFQITNETVHEDLRHRSRYRQKVFYKSCMQQLHDEKRSWTLFIDTDEYFVFNHYDEKEGPPTWCKKNVTCAQDYEKSIVDGSHIRAQLDRSPSATVAEHLVKHGADRHFDNIDKPCIIYGRYLFVSKESSRREIQRGVDSEFNATLFHTLRYRHRAPLSTYQLGKPIVDVSRYDGSDVPNPHRILGNLCTGYNAYVHNGLLSFRVHHYIGSWETFRQPGFDRRGKAFFEKRNNVQNLVIDDTTPRYSPSGNSTWLSQFVILVGKEKAVELTQNTRVREQLEMDKLVMEMGKGEQLYDWDKLNKKPGI